MFNCLSWKRSFVQEISNNTESMWFIEDYMCVFFPKRLRKWCKVRNFARIAFLVNLSGKKKNVQKISKIQLG